MMLQMSEEENIIFDKFMSEEDEEKRKMLHAELQRLRKEREEKELIHSLCHCSEKYDTISRIFKSILTGSNQVFVTWRET